MSLDLATIRRTLLLALIGATAPSIGCARAAPWQRERLATPAMTVRQDEAALATQYRGKLMESRMAMGLSGTAIGGGCGCSQ
jgi:hypothetical protein